VAPGTAIGVMWSHEHHRRANPGGDTSWTRHFLCKTDAIAYLVPHTGMKSFGDLQINP
jgi:hypothetical protein